jgi:hypothetical protein
MNWKPRLVIAGTVLLVSIILTACGFNHFIEAIGYMAAGFLFGTTPAPAK